MGEKFAEKELELSNANGLHVRPASLFVQTAMQFASDIDVVNLESSQHADGKSVMGMLMLSAPKGTRLRVTCRGNDCKEAVAALEDLVNRGFDED